MRDSSFLLMLLACSCLVACSPEIGGPSGGNDASPVGDGRGLDSADILLVVDNSNSMARIQEELQLHFGSLLEDLVTEGVDFQMGVTTTDVRSSGNGNQGNIRSLGALGSVGCQEPAILTPESGSLTEFGSLVNVGVDGSGDEQGIYAAALAMCKGKDATWWNQLSNLADDDPVKLVCSVVPESERECNTGFFRQDAASLVIVISDEGDDTERLESFPPAADLSQCLLEHNGEPFFGECECRLAWWVDFFDGIGQPVIFATVGPTFQLRSDDTPLCDGGTRSYPGPCNRYNSSTCAVEFYQNVACLTGGLYTPMEEATVQDDPNSCELSDFGAIATQIRELLAGG